MQLLRGLFAHGIIQIVATVFLVCLNCAAAAAALRLRQGKLPLLKWITFTLTLTLFGYIVASAILFTFDIFGVRKALLLEFLLTGGAALALFLRAKKRGGEIWGKLDTDLKPHLIPLILAAIALAVSWGNFGYFGMGQDQGVYQVKAINLMYGETKRVYSFSEAEKLKAEGKEETLYNTVRTTLLGLDLIDDTAEENRVLSAVRNGGEDTHAHTDGIFHGIPTYPALLALWGSIAGVAYMSGVQTLTYILALLMLWFAGENLGLKKGAAALMCVLFMLSPEAVWVSKSTLTEMPLALITACFLYALTNPEKEKRWQSAWMVVMFALVHVSIFAIIWMFLLLYAVLYLWNGERQYLRAMRISALGFMAGYTFMVLVAPRYSVHNTIMLWTGPVNRSNIYWIFMALSALAVGLSFALRAVKVRGKFRTFIRGKGGAWLMRAAIVLSLALSAYMSLSKMGDKGIQQALVTNGMYNMCWMTGLVFLPIALIALLRRPGILLSDDTGTGIAVVFGFAVLLMCSFLKAEISYCYYFGRYLTPYIPVACVVIALVWNRYSAKTVGLGLAVGTLVCAPFDAVMLWRLDDTNASYDTFSRVIEAVNTSDSAVIFQDHGKALMLAAKAITGNECYFPEEDVDAQAARLATTCGTVYCVSGREMDWELITAVSDYMRVDDNISFRPKLCPFPLNFLDIGRQYYVYRYRGARTFTAELLSTNGEKTEEGSISLQPGQIQYGPYLNLPAGDYKIVFQGENLSGADCYVTADKGQQQVNFMLIQKRDNETILCISPEEKLQDLEFVTKNTGADPVTVEKITLYALE